MSGLGGSGLGMPLGLLNPSAGIPICDTSALTPPGQFVWQDLLMLAYEIPIQWHDGCAFYMNQRTYALVATMSIADGRPLLSSLPEGAPGMMLAGFPIRILSQLPDVGPGATPIMFGSLQRGYTLVDRKATTLMVDPYILPDFVRCSSGRPASAARSLARMPCAC